MEISKDKAQFLINILNLLPSIQITMTIPDAVGFAQLSQELIVDLQAVVNAPDEEVALELGDADEGAEAAAA